ncbi:MAG: replication factor C small subunit [Faunusvirus sp.]|jgi:replication factor C subunit 2/4|uniref:Replication factor C small subunit n=1 Tax=Faunusvirus sp. TaxID=2487766 RepID=A0A3G4ZYZ4_9VIRU|nr:MAG: replication factor C small subunit [Faunusvirus sp.]
MHKFSDLFKTTKKRSSAGGIDIINTPLVEKYRPSEFNDILLDKHVYTKLNEMLTSKIITNLIISGSPGTGKTTTVLCLAKMLVGDYYDDGVIELNASDDRVVNAITEKIVPFCKKRIVRTENEGKIMKIVIMDEADNITGKAQNALSNLMDQFIDTTRFIFTCNDTTKIMETIQSKCMILRFSKLNNEQIKKRLIHIAKLENIKYTDEGLNAIVFTAQGDIRQAINNLETTFVGYDEITPTNVYKICSQPQPILITNIIHACLATDVTTAINRTVDLINSGYCSNDILLSMVSVLKEICINESIRISYIKTISETFITINSAVDSNLQLIACIAKMAK